MFDIMFAISIIGTAVQAVKDACTPTIPAENYANETLYRKDILDGVSDKQILKNIKNGKYKLTETYPEPHRDLESGKIIIENCKLYYEDVDKYGAHQAKLWVKQGKYNLSPEELKKEEERIKAKYDYLFSL